MSKNDNCPFCKATRKGMLANVPLKSGIVPCKRGLYEDDCCFAVLAPEQYSVGHTILILENHKDDITDNFSKQELSAFISAINLISKQLKAKAKNENNQSPQRIYVSILCDGVEHLHAHLIPRYPYTPSDEISYERLFLERDGRKEINNKVQRGDLGGFWYIADRERNYMQSGFGQLTDQEKSKFLENLAIELRISRPQLAKRKR